MANDAKKIRFAPNGALHVALTDGPTITPPTDLGTADTPPAGYKALGYVDEGGVTLTPAIETQPVNAWQSATPVLYTVTSASFSVKATLQETSQITTELFWGAKWVALMSNDPSPAPTGVYRLDLASTPELKELSLVVDWNEGAIRNRAVISRAMISDRGAIQLSRTENGKFELTIEALDGGGNLGYVLSNDDMIDAA
ncbi:hypothetical protein AB0J38_41190 [Streptomyces sp. NPDC050095]|uniref:phage tail tube protein n=1 Tax=unclassified Streptomyces TaxID=2593676 RepID=UPI00342D5D5E